MLDKNNVLAIVVAYNIDKLQLISNIKSYKKYVDKIVIVDNSDKTSNLNELNSEKIIYISMLGNFGIAKALNKGIEFALKNNYQFVLTMDQDSRFNNNIIEEYGKHISDDIIIYSPKYLISRKKEKKYSKETQEMYWTMTSGNVINLKLFKKVGFFKEKLFIDCVDYEYCLRAKKFGYKILQCNNAELIHNPGIEMTKSFLFFKYKYGYMSCIRLFYQIRNLSYIRKEYKSCRAQLLIIIKYLKICFLFDNKKEFFTYFKKAKKDFKNNVFGKYED